MKKIFKILTGILIFIILTIVTQIGGIVYLASLSVKNCWKTNLKFSSLMSFSALYLIVTFLITPFIAPFFGREKVRHAENVNPANYMTVVLNRNYVTPELNDMLTQTAKRLQGTKIRINYLDANFPFINRFPLLPHLSHDDGKKIDLSLIYEDNKGRISKKQKSMSGYGVFETPKSNEFNQTERCLKSGYWQYDYPKYLTFGTINQNLVFSKNGTKKLIKQLLKSSDLGKIFIEPHLKQRLVLKDSRVRNHGCKAVRHDDHIHIQLR